MAGGNPSVWGRTQIRRGFKWEGVEVQLSQAGVAPPPRMVTCSPPHPSHPPSHTSASGGRVGPQVRPPPATKGPLGTAHQSV